jgi:hypothetical protein
MSDSWQFSKKAATAAGRECYESRTGESQCDRKINGMLKILSV